MIQTLREKAQDVLGFEVKSAGVSVPHYPALYDEDISDAFDYLGLEYLQILWFADGQTSYLTYGATAALAGHGFGLCPDIKNASKYWDGSLKDSYFLVEYTQPAIAVHYVETYARGAYSVYDSMTEDYSLGSDARYESPDEDEYWDSLRYILETVLYASSYNLPTRIILVGESVSDPGFKHNFLMIMMDFFGIMVPPIYDKDPEYVQAKGVAELLRRRKYLPEPHRPCVGTPMSHCGNEPGAAQLPIEL
jgi:hypothetical protein